MARSAHAVIPRDTLLEAERVTRPPLRTWVADLVRKLDAAVQREPAGWLDIAGCMNNAALIEVFRGSRQGAHELCELQLRWVGNLIRAHGLAAAGALAAQPWVNIGRLRRIEGDLQGSLAHFSFFLDTSARRAVGFGPIAIDADTWQEIVQAKSMGPFVEAVYVVDSTKSYFAAKDHAGALAFIEQARPLITGAGTLPMMYEAEIIALAALERLDDAMAVTERPEWMRDGYHKLVRVTYRVALLAASGAVDSARALVAQLVPRVLTASFERPGDQRVLRYLHQLGVIAMHVGAGELGERIWRTGVRAAQHLADVPMELAFLESLMELDIADRDALAAERETLLRESLYAMLLRARGMSMEPVALAAPVFDELRARLEQVADSPLSGLSDPADASRMQGAAAVL